MGYTKKHLITIILLAFGGIAFSMGFYIAKKHQVYFTIASFALPTIAALIECCFAMKSDKELAKLNDCLTWK